MKGRSVLSTLRMKSWLLSLLSCCTASTNAFTVTCHHPMLSPPLQQRQHQLHPAVILSLQPFRTRLYASSLFEFTPNEMEDLILSISQEPTDDARRQRLQSVFAEALAERHHSERFTILFDQVLIIVGDRAQIIAQQKALEAAAAAAEEEEVESNHATVDTVAATAPPKKDFMAGKSAEQKQLWALVDMMVQSKIIVKKAAAAAADANGDLESRNSAFQ